MTRTFLFASLLTLLPAAASAQNGGRFVLLRAGKDTIANESFARDSAGFTGTLIRGIAPNRERIKYQVTVINGLAPLIELGVWRGDDPVESKARQNVRIIFKDDSVAVDEANDKTGVNTALFQTTRGALPYLNLSSVFLDLATRRARAAGKDSVAVPFFNLSGGQTVTAVYRKVGSDSATLSLGGIEFRLRVDPAGALLGGAVPSQNLTIVRGAAP